MSVNQTSSAAAVQRIDSETLEAITKAINILYEQESKEFFTDVFCETNENLLSFRDNLKAKGANEGTHSDVTRALTVFDYLLTRDHDLTPPAKAAVIEATDACSTVAAQRELTTCFWDNCNGAAERADLTADWDGTKREIVVCPDCYQGVDESDIPIDEKYTQRDPSDPPVEGVDEVRAHRQDGMAGVYHLRRDKDFLKSTL